MPLLIKVHPAKAKPGLAILLGFFILGFGWFFGAILQNWFWGLLAGLLLFFSLTRFFFPTTYYLTLKQLKIKSWLSNKTFPWSRFRVLKSYRGGIYLSPLPELRRFDRFRGIFLPLDEKEKINLEEIIQELIRARE